MTTPSPYDESARRMLAREATASDTPEAQIAAAERVLGRLQEHLLRWFGPDGFHAVLSRALATARKSHPALAHVHIEPWSKTQLTELAASAHIYRPAEQEVLRNTNGLPKGARFAVGCCHSCCHRRSHDMRSVV